jgi:hypothetical protein
MDKPHYLKGEIWILQVKFQSSLLALVQKTRFRAKVKKCFADTSIEVIRRADSLNRICSLPTGHAQELGF